MSGENPFLVALVFMQKNYGTSGQEALAKCILSMYNDFYAFAISEILPSLDSSNKALVLAMLLEYSRHGETDELREAGNWAVRSFPYLVELSSAMHLAKTTLQRAWRLQREAELRILYPEEKI